jgi:hypothetical protein
MTGILSGRIGGNDRPGADLLAELLVKVYPVDASSDKHRFRDWRLVKTL